MTNNFDRRLAEHSSCRGWIIERYPGLPKLSPFNARGVEQALIEKYGLGNLYNKINSIALNNPIYEEALKRGNQTIKESNLINKLKK